MLRIYATYTRGDANIYYHYPERMMSDESQEKILTMFPDDMPGNLDRLYATLTQSIEKIDESKQEAATTLGSDYRLTGKDTLDLAKNSLSYTQGLLIVVAQLASKVEALAKKIDSQG